MTVAKQNGGGDLQHDLELSEESELEREADRLPSLSPYIGNITGYIAGFVCLMGLLLCVPNVSPGSTTATTGYSPHSHHFPFCKSQPPHVEPCDVILKLRPPGSAWSVTSSVHRLLKDTWKPPSLSGHGEIRGNMTKRFLCLVQAQLDRLTPPPAEQR
ncbi:hypothetical protein HPB51_009515 [Rhipicephalus microplus]|uniref:Uncharacterized protein n=1 Tax=Rhipicephalus microplus TaxID=6941 RepID=A0A9J6EGF7_RHIMP|nr:hypothetical protein HPB51_009515 [Rhipicephalus microplus]